MFKNIKNDLPASIVVFFVALPLCLGIALASGAPLFSGIISGIVGGIIVGFISGSKLGVSGPAAGLAAIVLSSIQQLGAFESFLLAVVIAGLIQILLGLIKAGVIGYFFPSSVIKGMLTGIGIIIILKQIPHFFGYDNDPSWDFEFFELNGGTSLGKLFNTINKIHPGASLIGIISLIILVVWENILSKKHKIFKLIQGPFVVVVLGVIFHAITHTHPILSVEEMHLVRVPLPQNVNDFIGQFSTPDFSAISNSKIWVIAFTIAVVASLETLLSVEATDKLDPHKNVTPTNRELIAQGIGNVLSGMIGGIPITQVIVRSSANIQSGGRSKLSTILHGFLLLLSVILIPKLLNQIPLAVLAAVLLTVGYKLAKPSTFVKMYKLGWIQFVPFIATVLGVVFEDLLIGVGIGLALGIFVILLKNYQNSHFVKNKIERADSNKVEIILSEEVTFLNKGSILKQLEQIPENAFLEIDVRRTKYLDYDVLEIFEDFVIKAKDRNISVTLLSERGTVTNPDSYINFFTLMPIIDPYKEV